jgi:hypothetical protein
MAILVGGASRFTWSGTFMGVLLPAMLVGAALAWAEQSRRKGRGAAWRWTALTPLLFIVAPALAQENFVAVLVSSGLGTGAIGTALIGMLGGYAISGRGPAWARMLSRTVMVALVIAAVVGAALAPADQLGLATPAGAYVLLAFLVLSGLLAWACAIPHLPAYHDRAVTRRAAAMPAYEGSRP